MIFHHQMLDFMGSVAVYLSHFQRYNLLRKVRKCFADSSFNGLLRKSLPILLGFVAAKLLIFANVLQLSLYQHVKERVKEYNSTAFIYSSSTQTIQSSQMLRSFAISVCDCKNNKIFRITKQKSEKQLILVVQGYR